MRLPKILVLIICNLAAHDGLGSLPAEPAAPKPKPRARTDASAKPASAPQGGGDGGEGAPDYGKMPAFKLRVRAVPHPPRACRGAPPLGLRLSCCVTPPSPRACPRHARAGQCAGRPGL